MNWQTVLQVTTSAMATLGIWFIYDLIREFKDWKKQSASDIISLKKERSVFEQVVRSSELSMAARVMELNSALENSKTHVERGLGIIDNELARIRMSIERANEKATKFDEFMKLSVQFNQVIIEKQKQLEADLANLK